MVVLQKVLNETQLFHDKETRCRHKYVDFPNPVFCDIFDKDNSRYRDVRKLDDTYAGMRSHKETVRPGPAVPPTTAWLFIRLGVQRPWPRLAPAAGSPECVAWAAAAVAAGTAAATATAVAVPLTSAGWGQMGSGRARPPQLPPAIFSGAPAARLWGGGPSAACLGPG